MTKSLGIGSTTGHRLLPGRVLTMTLRDGTVYRLSETQLPIVIGGNTFDPMGSLITLDAIRLTGDGTVPSTQITAAIMSSGIFTQSRIDLNKFEDAEVKIYVVARTIPTWNAVSGWRSTAASFGTPYFVGNVAKTTKSYPQDYAMEVRGKLAKGKGVVMEHFGPTCRTDLGSNRCKVPIYPPGFGGTSTVLLSVQRSTAYALGQALRYNTTGGSTPAAFAEVYFEVTTAGTTSSVQPAMDTTIGNTTTDGTVVVTARDSWTRWGQVTSITDSGHGIVINRDPDPRAVDNWFNEGLIFFVSGLLNGQAEVIADWDQAGRKLTTFMNMTGKLVVGDYIEFSRGCDLKKATCVNPFNNAKNFRGENDWLGTDATIGGG